MQTLSFAHLKDKKTKNDEVQEKIPEIVKTEKTDLEFDPLQGLMDSKYCYGCLKFSVDFPNTFREAGWCRRDDENGEVVFKRIKRKFKIKLCPGKVTE